MKKITLSIAMVLIVLSSFAQVSYGVKGGFNLGKQKLEDDGVSLTSDFRFSAHLGGYLTYDLSDKFAIQPELLFSSEGGNFSDDNFDSKTVFSFINLPVLARYAATDKLSIVAGPQLGFLLAAKSKSNDETVDFKDDVKGLNLSLALGLGYEVAEKIEVYGRYNLGLSDLNDLGGDTKLILNTLQFGVAYKLN